jgi:threonine dehydrogenase-like Zn-dependent dehydrogenase
VRAITVIPGQPGSVALTDMPEPPPGDGPILVETQAVGICGTDGEIIDGSVPLPSENPGWLGLGPLWFGTSRPRR